MHKNKMLVGACLLAPCLMTTAHAVELVNTTNNGVTTKVSLGGYGKIDARYVSGDVAYQDYWVANFPGGEPVDTSRLGFNVKESRINFKVQHGDVTGVVEMDFYGGGGNEVVSNSSNPRLRHFYINYKEWMVGQNWTTFMPLHALPEALDFGGPHTGEVFIRQTQIRYSKGNWQFALENPETNGDGDIGAPNSAVGLTGAQADKDESTPDFVARYNLKGDWGLVSFGGLVRKIDQGGADETAVAFNIAGRIKTFGKDDFRFQVTSGEAGRYVSAGMTPDIVITEDSAKVESSVAYTIAYRHFWNETTRSSIYYGTAESDELERKRSHLGINLVTSLTKQLDLGIEYGNYAIDDKGMDSIDSDYLQVSAKYKF